LAKKFLRNVWSGDYIHIRTLRNANRNAISRPPPLNSF